MTIAREVAAYVTANPAVIAAVAVAALAAVLAIRRLLRGRQAEDLLTLLAAGLAQAVVMTGMWRFAGNVLHFSGAERISLFAFLEIAVVACAFRARRNMKKFNSAGVEGIAVWVLSALSGIFAALDASSFTEAVFRLSAPLVAAWLWHRAMSLERRERTGQRTHWRLTAERILVWLHLAEPAERTASEVDAHRRIARLARAAKKLRELRAAGAKPWRQSLALRWLDKALEGAVEHASLAVSTERQDQMLAQIGALNAAVALAELSIAPPWARPEPAAPVPLLSRVETLDILARTITPVPEPAPAHHEPPLPSGTVREAPGPAPVPREPEPPDDFDREAAEVFGTAVPPARPGPVPEPASPPVRPPAKAPAGKWTPEAAGLSAAGLRAIIAETGSRNKLADRLGVGRSTASNIIRDYGAPEPALNGSR